MPQQNRRGGLCAFRVIGSFVSEPSCLRLASAVLMEIGDEWETGKSAETSFRLFYLPMETKQP